MAVVCPNILADSQELYDQQIQRVAGFAHRLQIDLADGQFAKPKTVAPPAAWWPAAARVDIHLMFGRPLAAAEILVKHSPHLIIAHAEATGSFGELAVACRRVGVKVGVALLPETAVSKIADGLAGIDHVLIFSGSLGSFGGHANLSLLDKVKQLKGLKPELEIGWDGGINDQNAAQLILGGVDVLDVGGFIQQADDPAKAFAKLARIADETGTT